jgi:hypothetical protein
LGWDMNLRLSLEEQLYFLYFPVRLKDREDALFRARLFGEVRQLQRIRRRSERVSASRLESISLLAALEVFFVRRRVFLKLPLLEIIILQVNLFVVRKEYLKYIIFLFTLIY